jgi:hypothetical protein
LMRNPEDNLSTDTDNADCAPAKLRCAMIEAMFVFKTDDGIDMVKLLQVKN